MVSPVIQGFGLNHARNIINSGKWFWNNVGAPTAGFIGQQTDIFKDSHTERNNEALEPTGYNMDSIREAANRNEPVRFKTDPIELYKRYQEQYMNPEKWDSLFANTIQVDNTPVAQIYDYPSSWENSSDPKKVKAWLQNEQLKAQVQEKELQVLEEVPSIGKDSYQSRIYGTQKLTAITDTVGEVDSKRFLENFDNTTEDITGLNFKDRDHATYWSLDNWKDIGYNLVAGGGKVSQALDPVNQAQTLATESFKGLLEASARNEGKTTAEAYASGLIAPPDSPTRLNPLNNPVVDFVKTVATNSAQKQIGKIFEGGTQLFDEGLSQMGRPYQARLYMDRLLPEAVKGTPIGQTATQIAQTGIESLMPGLGTLNALNLMNENKVQIYYDAIVKDEKSKGTYKKGWIAEDNRLDQAAQMAIDNGDIPWAKRLAAEVITDPIELVPTIGIYGGVTRGAIRGSTIAAKTLRPRAITFDVLKNELRLPKINTLGLNKPNISFKSLHDTDINTKVEMKRILPTLKNIFTRNPTVDKNLISEPRVNVQNVLENNIGVTHEEADAFINVISNAALTAGKNPANELSNINFGKSFNYVNDLFIPDNTLFKFGNESIETTTRNSNLLIKKGHPIYQTNLSVAFDLIDEVDQINRIPINKNAINIKEGGLNLIGRDGLLTATGASKSKEFQKIALKLSDDELVSTGITRWLEGKYAQGIKTVSLDELRRYEEDSRGIVIANEVGDIFGGMGNDYIFAAVPGTTLEHNVTTIQVINRNLVELADELGFYPKDRNEHYKDILDGRVVVSNLSNLLPNSKGLNWESILKADENIVIHERSNVRYFFDPTDGQIKIGSHTDELQSDYHSKLNRGGTAHSFTNLWKSLTTGFEASDFNRFERTGINLITRNISETAQKAIYNVPGKISKRTNQNSVWASKTNVNEFKNQYPNDPRLELITRGNGYTGIKRFVHMTPFNKTVRKYGFEIEKYLIAGIDEVGEAFLDLTYNDIIKSFERLFTESSEFLNIVSDPTGIINEKVFTVNAEQFFNLIFKDAKLQKADRTGRLKLLKDQIIPATEIQKLWTSFGTDEPIYLHVKQTAKSIELDIGIYPSNQQQLIQLTNPNEMIIDFYPEIIRPKKLADGTTDNIKLSVENLFNKFESMVKEEMFTEVLGKTNNFPKTMRDFTDKFVTEKYTKVTEEPSKTSYDPEFIIFSKQDIADGKAPIRIMKFPEGWSISENTFTPEKLAEKDPTFTYRNNKQDAIDDAFIFLNSHRNDIQPYYMPDSMLAEKHMNVIAGYSLQKAALQRHPFRTINTPEILTHRYSDVTTPYSLYGEKGKIMKAYLDHAGGMLSQVGYNIKGKSLRLLIKKVKMLTPENPSQYVEDASSYYDVSVTPKKRIDKAGKYDTYTDKQLEEFNNNPNKFKEGIGAEQYTSEFMEAGSKAIWNITGNESLIKVLDEFEFGDESNQLGVDLLARLDQQLVQMDAVIRDPELRLKHPNLIEESHKIESLSKFFETITTVGYMHEGAVSSNITYSIKELIEHYGIPSKFTRTFSDNKFITNNTTTLTNVKSNFTNNNVDDLITYLAERALEFKDPTNVKDITGYNRLTLKPRELEGMPGFEVPGIDLDANVEKLFGVATDLNGKPLENAPKTLGEIYRHNQIRLYKTRPETNTNGNILGYTDFSKDGETVINILRSGDFNTLMHEGAHYIRRSLLTEQDLETVGRIVMGDNNWDALPNKNVWTVEAEEMFANQFELYIKTGQAKKGLARVFDRMIDYLKTFYRSIRNTTVEKELNPELRKFFDTYIDIGRPTKEKIISSLPTHEQADALKFFGYDGGTIPTPVLPSTIKGVALHDQPRYAEQQAETILFKTEQDEFTGLRNNIKSQEQAINELPWDEYKKWEIENLDETEVGLDILPDTQSMEQIISSNFVIDSWEVLAQTPGIREIARLFNPSAAARNPLFKSIIALRRMQEQATSLTTNAIARLDRLGSSQKVFGSFDDTGRISEGPLKGFNVNDIRSRPLDPRWRNLLTNTQRVWIRTAESLERAKLAMLKAEGIDIRTLPEAEGGGTVYAGRRTFAQIANDGEVLDLINMGVGSRPGAKAAFEKARKFETMEEAIENGYRYIPDEEALRINIEAAYNRVAYQRHMQYILDNVTTARTAAAPEKLKITRDLAAQRLKQSKALLRQLYQTRRGENIAGATLRSLKINFPEIAERLDTISKLTLEDVIKAGEAAKGQPISFKPTKKYFSKVMAKVLQLETQVKALKEQGLEVPVDLATELDKAQKHFAFAKFARGKAYESFKAGKGFQYTFYKSAQSILLEPRVGLIDELIDIVGGVKEPGTRRRRGGLIQNLTKEASESQREFSKASEEASQLQRGEGIFRDAPAYSGRIFTRNQPDTLGGMSGQDVSNMLNREIIGKNQGYEGGFANVLKSTRVFNAATRFFTLGADASVFFIHLVFMWGESVTNPALMGNIAKGFVASIFSPTYHAKLIDDNAELLAKYPDVIVGTGARFETTEYFNLIKRAGFNKYKPFRMARKAIEAPYIPAQRAFESALDSAAVQLLKAFDHLGVDEKSIREISDYVNEIRGLASGKRLGVSSKQRDWERQALLAPSYNRAIAALMSDLIKPSLNMRNFTPGLAANADLRVQLARRSFARGMAAIAIITIAANMSQGMDMEDIVTQRLNPTSPGFLGVNIGGNEIGFGSKARSIIQLWARMGVAAYEGNSEEFIPQSMTELGAPLRFVRGNLSFGAQSATTILTGKTYMGDRIYKDNIWDSAKAFGANVFPGPFLGPIWAQSALFEGGSVTDRGTRGVAEAFGGRGYPEGSYQILKEFTKNNLDMDYEDLEPFERRIIRTLLEPQLTPIQMERIEQGDNTAGYWAAIEDLDAIRLTQEESILLKYQQRIGKYAEGGLNALRQDFYNIQQNFAQQKQLLNQQFDMFQDDVEFDEDDPAKFVMSEWYGLYEKASDPQTGLLNYDKLNALQRNFWQQELPDGTLYNNYFGYIRRNTSSTTHPAEFARVLSGDTVLTMNLAAQARIDLLNSRPGWAQAFDKFGYKLEDFSIWK